MLLDIPIVYGMARAFVGLSDAFEEFPAFIALACCGVLVSTVPAYFFQLLRGRRERPTPPECGAALLCAVPLVHLLGPEVRGFVLIALGVASAGLASLYIVRSERRADVTGDAWPFRGTPWSAWVAAFLSIPAGGVLCVAPFIPPV